MIFQDNIVKKYLQIHSKKYGILNNFYFYCKESFIYNKLGFILSLFLVPAGIIKSLASIFIPKLVIDSLGNFKSEYTFLINIIIVTVVIAVSSIVELLAKNTMEHNMNSFVLIQLNKLWVEKVSTMDYEVFTSELGKQSASKARMTLEGTTRWGIGTYIPRLLELLTSFIGIMIYGVMLIYVHPLVLAALITAYAVNMVVTLYAEKKKQMIKDDAAKAERKMNYFAYSTRGLSIAKDIRVYSMREWISQMAGMARLDKKKVDDKVQSYQLFVVIVNGIVVLLRDGLVYLILIWLTLKGDITIGSFALYAAAVNGLGEWLAQITTGVGAFRESDNNVTDFRQFLSLPDGKTTLIKLICGLLHPSDGQILIDGIPISSVAWEDCSKAISAVFQESVLLPVSIKRNIVMNDKKVDEDRLARIVALVGLEDKIASLEMGLETPLVRHITENGTEFSGGEVQKLLLARAIYKESPVLILDEPTAAMDPIAEQNVYLQYNELSKNKTAFFISHRLSSTRFCDRIILIDGGKISEAGTHDELMDKGGLYHDMYMIQSRYYQEGVLAI